MLKNKLFLIIGICLVLSNFSFAQEETQQPVLEEVKESVTCIFTNTDLAQACYPNIGTPCKGTNSCTTTISGARGTQITWKSSCGSYASTTLDGNNEEIKFECPTLNPILIQQPPTLTQPTPIPPLEPSETKAEISGNTDWKFLYVNRLAPALTTKVRISGYAWALKNQGTINGNVYIDDMTFSDTPPSDLILNPGFENAMSGWTQDATGLACA